MAETKFTPGPWQVIGDSIYAVKRARNGNQQHIAVISKKGASIVDCEANAALIASAPDLLRQRDVLLNACRDVIAALRENETMTITEAWAADLLEMTITPKEAQS